VSRATAHNRSARRIASRTWRSSKARTAQSSTSG
jgi:hypothetical protein